MKKGFPFLQQNESEKSFINIAKIISILLVVIILMSGGTVLVSIAKVAYSSIESIFVSLVLSIILVFIFKPIILFFESFNLNRTLSIILLYLGIFFLIGTFFGTIIPFIEKEINVLKNELPRYRSTITETASRYEKKIIDIFPAITEMNISKTVSDYAKQQVFDLNETNIIKSSTQVIGSFFTLIIMVPFITFFLLKDGHFMKKSLLTLVPNRYFEKTLNLLHEINKQLGTFIRARIIEAICVGLICYIGLLILGIKFSIVLAIFASLMNLIPYIGPLFGAIPALFVAFMDTGQWSTVIWVISIYGVAQLVDIFIIIPTLFSKIVNMHPLMVVIVIVIGGQLGGIIGMILAVPIYSIVKVTFKEIYEGINRMNY